MKVSNGYFRHPVSGEMIRPGEMYMEFAQVFNTAGGKGDGAGDNGEQSAPLAKRAAKRGGRKSAAKRAQSRSEFAEKEVVNKKPDVQAVTKIKAAAPVPLELDTGKDDGEGECLKSGE